MHVKNSQETIEFHLNMPQKQLLVDNTVYLINK